MKRWMLVFLFAACDCGHKPSTLPDASLADGQVADAHRPGDDAGLAPRPTCSEDGCLRDVAKVGDYSKAFLLPYLDPAVNIDNGYSIYNIEFSTQGRPARATIAVPYDAAVPPAGWNIVANDHGTTGLDDPCVVAGTIAGAGYAGLFGAHGMIGVAPDYPGLGEPGLQPYLVAHVEGAAALDALRATRSFALWSNIPISNRFAMVGLSQGGHAVLASAAMHRQYAPDLNMKAFAASGPATVWEEHWRQGVASDGPWIALHAMLIYSWADHYGFHGGPLWAAGATAKIDNVMHTYCAVAPDATTPTISDELGNSSTAIFSPAFLTAYQTGNWGTDYAPFGDYFRENRIGPYDQTAPIKIYQGDADDTVPEWTTHAVVDALRAGGDTIEYEVVPGGGHIDVAFGFVAYPQKRTDESLLWIRQHLDAN